MDICGFPVHGNATTDDEISPSFAPGVANVTLGQVYAAIVNSASFENVSMGLGWVTTYWGTQQDSGPGYSYSYVIGQFLFVSAGHPEGFIQADYNLETKAVSVQTTGFGSSCVGGPIASSSGAQLDQPSPAYYAIGQPVKMTFYVVDDAVANMSVRSSTSCLGNFTILQGTGATGTTGPEVYDSTTHPGCSGAPLNLVLNRGESYNQTMTWNQTDDSGAQVPPGTYEVMETDVASPQNFSSPVGVVYIGTPISTLNSTILRQQFYYEGYLGNDFVSPGQPVKVVWVLSNNGGAAYSGGQQTYDLQTSGCSYAYTILNLSGDVIYSSAAHASCNNQLQDNVTPQNGGIGHVSYWNQTNNSGATVSPGFYRLMIDLHVWNGGHEFNLTYDSDLEITPSSNPLSGEQISVESSSMCATDCGGSGPYLDSSVDANGNLTSLRAYLNGTLLRTRTYNLPCCQLAYQFSFDAPIDNSTIPVVAGVSYDLGFVGTFQDGNTSVSWANPLNPPS